jgi:very-short-patch-repair endonuclease
MFPMWENPANLGQANAAELAFISCVKEAWSEVAAVHKRRKPLVLDSMIPGARQLRKRQASAESVLWSAIRNRKLGGLKFRRQQPMGLFVVDFFCFERLLVVELDGSIHELTAEQDAERTRLFEANGLRVIRFANQEVFTNIDHVLQANLIAAEISAPLLPYHR